MLVTRAIVILQGHDDIKAYPLYRLLYFLGRLSTSWFKEELPPPTHLHSRLALIYHVQSVLDIHLKVSAPPPSPSPARTLNFLYPYF